MIPHRFVLAAVLALIAVPASAQDYPRRIPAPHGEVILPTARHQRSYDVIQYAPARRVGDMLYVSGVIVGRAPDEGTDAESFKKQVRRAFVSLDTVLKASGASFEDVVMINSYHVWEGPNQPASRSDHVAMFNAVKSEFMKPPHAAWTAVGASGLVQPNGIVEVQLIAKIGAR